SCSTAQLPRLLCKTAQDAVAVEKHDLLILGAAGRRVGVEAQAFQRVEQQRLADGDLRLPVGHAIVEFDGPPLGIREARMWSDLQKDLPMPGDIFLRASGARLGLAYREDAGEEKILEALVLPAKGPRVPAEAVESQGVRLDPAPGRLGLRHGLVGDLKCAPFPGSGQHGTQDLRGYASRWCGCCAISREVADPDLFGGNEPQVHGLQL